MFRESQGGSNCVVKIQMKHQFSDFYQRMLPPEVLENKIGTESVNCNDCAMKKENRPELARKTYLENLKCCTFEPFVSHFSAGGILQQSNGISSLFRESLMTGIAMPIGVSPNRAYQKKFNLREKSDFGRDAREAAGKQLC